MPEFEVELQHEVVEYLIVKVEADTAAEADKKVQATIEACGYDVDVIAMHYSEEYQETWDVAQEDITVAIVEQLDRV